MGELTDDELRSRLGAYGELNRDYWSFRGNATRRHAHAYFQYPAMMVPQMIGDLLASVAKPGRRTISVYDPFAGSGTALTEAMLRGLNFSGQDINPLAVLVCQAKTIPFFDTALEGAVYRVTLSAGTDRSTWVEACFPGRQKWFSEPVAVGLSRLQRAIRAEQALWVRRFLWVALAETVRLTSNSRTSTFKLHIRPKDELATRQPLPLDVFAGICSRNLSHLREQKRLLSDRGHLDRGRYKGIVSVHIADTTSAPDARGVHDVLLTSPPYGDNVTTVPYGQHSYLPLQWIDLDDIQRGLGCGHLRTTHEIDRKSLGGGRAGLTDAEHDLTQRSKALHLTLKNLRHAPRDRAARVLGFCRDLHRCVGPILTALRPNATMIWILGNRLVGGKPVPLDSILGDFLLAEGARPVLTLSRRIPSKRMAVRNNIVETMRSETILVMRKGPN